MKRWVIIGLLLVAAAAFAGPEIGGVPSRGLPGRGLPDLGIPAYGTASPSVPASNTAARMIVLFGSLVAMLLAGILGATVHNGAILRRILAAVTPPRIEVPVNLELAAAMREIEDYIDGKAPPKGMT
jgi:hypothetical protein